MGSPEGAIEHQTSLRTLFLVALVFSTLQTIIRVGGSLLASSLFASVPPSEFSIILTLALSVPSFLINPLLLFYVFYLLGKRVRLRERYIPVGASTFLGGTIGALVYYPLIFALSGSSSPIFPDLLSAIGWTFSLGLALLGSGLAILFPGFVAMTVANFRREEKLGSE